MTEGNGQDPRTHGPTEREVRARLAEVTPLPDIVPNPEGQVELTADDLAALLTGMVSRLSAFHDIVVILAAEIDALRQGQQPEQPTE